MKTRLRLVEAQSAGGRDVSLLKERQCKATLAELKGMRLTTEDASSLSEAIPGMGWEPEQVDRLLEALVASPFSPSLPHPFPSPPLPPLISSTRPFPLSPVPYTSPPSLLLPSGAAGRVRRSTGENLWRGALPANHPPSGMLHDGERRGDLHGPPGQHARESATRGLAHVQVQHGLSKSHSVDGCRLHADCREPRFQRG